MDFLNPKPKPKLRPEARERQLAGKHKGLLHAAQNRKADNSANYANNFDHGQTATDFERSAEAAGETREEVRNHLALVDRTLLMLCGFFALVAAALPQLPLHSDATSPRAPKLVRALALLLWRPLRLFRTQENWETLAICYRLRQVVRWREKHGELTAQRVDTLREYLQAIVDNWDSEFGRRLKRIQKRFWKVWKLYRSLVGVLTSVFGGGGGESASQQANDEDGSEISNDEDGSEISNDEDGSEISNYEGGSEISNDEDGSEISNLESSIPLQPVSQPSAGRTSQPPLQPVSQPSAGRTSQPPLQPVSQPSLERAGQCPPADEPGAGDEPTPAREPAPRQKPSSPDGPSSRVVAYPATAPLVQQRGTPHYEQFHPTWDQRIDDLTPEAIAGLFQSPSHTLKAQERRSQPAQVKDPNDWQEHPPKPPLADMEFPELPATDVIRNPSERELRRMVRKGNLKVPGSFEDFLALVEAALGTRDSGLGTRDSGSRNPNTESRTPGPESRALLHALAESLWNRMHVFSARVAELRELLEATLVWDSKRFLPMWLKMLDVEYAYYSVDLFERTHGPGHADIEWGDEEDPQPRRRPKPRPAIVPRSEAERRQKHAGELQHALRLWFSAVWHALVPVIRGSHKVTVAFYDWAVSRFGIREEFLEWRPKLSLQQLETRRDRPEWAVRVVTVTGKTLVKLDDGRIFEPEK